MVVLPTTEVFVGGDESERRRGLRHGEAVEAVLEHGVDVAVGAGADGDGAGAGRLQAGLAIARAEPQEAEARAVALLGMRAVGENRLDKGRRRRADRAGPGDEARGGPLQVALMGLGHVGRVGGVAAAAMAADVGGDPLAAMEDLDGRGREARIDVLVDEGVGDGVVMPVQLDVIVDVDASVHLPLAVDEGLGRQGAERGPVQTGEQLVPARAVQAHGAGIQVGQQLGDARVEGGEREEGLVAEAGEDPAFHDLHRDFDLRLVPWLRRPGRQDHGAVVLSELLVRALQPGLVAAGDHDAALELVTHHGGGDPAKELEGALMARQPVGHLLGAGRVGVGIVRGAQDRHEEFDGEHFPGQGVDDRRLLPRVVHEALVAGVVDLAHRQAPAVKPAPVELAELGVAVAVRVLLEVLQVEQFEGDAGLVPLGVQDRAVGDGPMMRGRRRRPVEPGLQHLVAERLDLRPVEPGGAGPSLDAGDGPQAGPHVLGHLPVAPPQGPLLSQDLADLPHG